MRLFLCWLLAGGLLLGLTSCEKVIDLEVGDSTPQVVIEAEVSDLSIAWRVQLSQTVSITSSSAIVPLSGARVWITDATAGITDTLGENNPGLYLTDLMNPTAGVPGHRYHLTVVTPDKGTFMATSTMPKKVPFDSVYVEVASFFGQRGGQVFPVYKDPPGVLNFYQFIVFGGSKNPARDARNDQFSDGIVSGQPLFLPLDDSVKPGDSLVVEMQCIDESVFKYFFLLFQSQGGAGGTAAAPGNPTSNISGGALGYFSAHTVSRRGLVIK